MKKKLLAIVSTVAMLIALIPGVAFANEESVAKVGETEYASLQEAFDNVKTGDTVVLLKDITLTKQVNITKALNGLTFDGGGHTITCATTTDPSQSGGSALYFGDPNSSLWCTGITVKNLNMKGMARFGMFFSGGTTSVIENVNISGEYFYAINLYGTHGATFKNCDISNSKNLGETNENGSAIWSNVAADFPIKLYNTHISCIAINKYTTANKIAPKIFIHEGSRLDAVHSYDEGDVSGNTNTCLAATSEGELGGLYLFKAADNIVEKQAYIAELDGVKYKKLQDAVDAAESGDTVKLLQDATGDGVAVASGKNITIDFNGKTYNVDGTVGSTGTETNGFQLLKDSNIVLKNGKITSDKAKILIQNYSNLTLDNMVLDGRNLVGSKYVLSNNHGDTVIGEGTKILAADDGVAFDVYFWQAYYGDGVSVTVEKGTQIDGKIEYADESGYRDFNGDPTDKAKFLIKGGNFSGEIVIPRGMENPENGVSIKGGEFQVKPPQELVDQDSALIRVEKNTEDATYIDETFIVGTNGELEELLKDRLEEGDKVEVLSGDLDIEIPVAGVDVSNSTENESGNVVINGVELEPGTGFKTTAGGAQGDATKTGDSSNMMIWLALMTLAAAGGVGTVLYRRKNNA